MSSFAQGVQAGAESPTDGSESLPVAEQVYRQIRDAIAAGRLAPRARLSERELSASFGVSTSPIKAALKRAGLTPADVDYINAHGTSTMADTIELGAVERLVGEAASNVSMSSTKSSIGHLLGAAGAAEAIFSLLAIRDNVAPPTINLDNPERETAIDLVPNAPRARKIDVALSNSFGFGGTNASLVFRRLQD